MDYAILSNVACYGPAGDGAGRGGEVYADSDGLPAVSSEREGVVPLLGLAQGFLRRAVEFQFDDI